MTAPPPGEDKRRHRRSARSADLTHSPSSPPDAVYVFDASGACRWMSPAGEAFLGLDRSSIVGRHVLDLFPPKHPDPEAVWRAAAEYGTPSSMSCLLATSGGSLDVRVDLLPVADARGRVRFVVGIARAAGETASSARRSPSRQRTGDYARELEVVDDIASIVAARLCPEELYQRFTSEVARLVDFNGALIAVLDDDDESAVVAHLSCDAPIRQVSGDRWPLEGSGIGRVTEPRASVIEDDLEQNALFLEDSTLLEAGARSVIRVPFISQERVVGAVVLWSGRRQAFGPRERRILERMAAQIAPAIENARLYQEVERTVEMLKTTQEHLMRVERLRAMGELASGVAHDLNNALAAILGRTQLMLNQVSHAPHLRSLHMIEQAARDSAQVVRRILDFARLESDTQVCGVDVNPLVDDVVELTRHKWLDEAQSKGQDITIETNKSDVPPALANYSELREVLTNLIINACEAISRKGRVEISTSVSGGRVCISVSDTGAGMSAEVRERAFDPFFTTKGASGTGLGLSMALGILARYQGDIELDSQEGKGTTVRVSLPVASSEEAPQAAQEEAAAKPAPCVNVLVVEDEALIRETLSEMLSMGGHQVTLAASGEEGIRLFQEHDYDLVFTDLGMPGVSGWEVAEAMKQHRSDVPIVMVTGWGVSLDQDNMADLGIDDVLPKPFDIDQVLTVVQNATSGGSEDA